MGEWDEVIALSKQGRAVVVQTPYGRGIHFTNSPVDLEKRTILTEEILNEIADEYEANKDQWPQNQGQGSHD